MNYIGSKHKLIGFIKDTIYQIVGKDLSDKIFADIFAGTGIVARSFKKKVKKMISNDLEYYSFVLNKNYIENYSPIKNGEQYIEELNNMNGVEGFIYKNYCQSGSQKRLYFSDHNGKKIDAVRLKIEQKKSKKSINKATYYFLLASLLESADKIANTASVYGAYLKQLKPSAQIPFILKPAKFEFNTNKHKVYNTDSNELIRSIKGDIVYLDPPYNSRQYGANYHLLNTIAKYDTFLPRGKTGLRKYSKSKYCHKNQVAEVFEDLIKHAKFKFIFLSYNNEGLLSTEQIRIIMKKYGKYQMAKKDHQRFKADKNENRKYTANKTTEYLHILEKN